MELAPSQSPPPLDGLFELVAASLLAPLDAALVRLWLLRPGDRCASCGMRSECADRTRCLHLVASAGATERTDGPFRRFPLGAREVGRTATTGEPWFGQDEELEVGFADPAWLAAHRIRGFVAWPVRGEEGLVGVLAAFARRPLGETDGRRLTSANARLVAALAREGHAMELGRRCEALAAENARLRSDLRTLRLAMPASMADATGDPGPSDSTPDRRSWVEIERDALESVLRETGWRVSGPRGAAARLGLPPTTLESRMKRLGVRRPANVR